MDTPIAQARAFDSLIAGETRDPHPDLAQKRRETPIEGDGPFMVYRYEDAAQGLKDSETFSSKIIRDFMGPVMGEQMLLSHDGAVHRRYRGLVSGAFSQRSLARWEDELIRPTIAALLDKIATKGQEELVEAFTFLFPAQVIAALFGLPSDDVSQFQRWTLAINAYTANPEAGIRASQELETYLSSIVAERRISPKDDLISALVMAELEGSKLTEEELYSFLKMLLPAGIETTYRGSGNMIFALLTHPEQKAKLLNDWSLIGPAIEETLRWESPTQLTTRITTKETTLGGVAIPNESMVTFSLASANRDESIWNSPERFDMTRAVKPHLAFGYGPHLCVGAHLARLEMRVGIRMLFERLPDLALDLTGEEPFIRGDIFRSPNFLPVRFTPTLA
jgi:cytochrome P450